MSLVIALGIWVAVSAVAAPLIGYYLGGHRETRLQLTQSSETALAPRKHS